jgi:hypothetical protein
MTPLLNHLNSTVSWFPPLGKVRGLAHACEGACM